MSVSRISLPVDDRPARLPRTAPRTVGAPLDRCGVAGRIGSWLLARRSLREDVRTVLSCVKTGSVARGLVAPPPMKARALPFGSIGPRVLRMRRMPESLFANPRPARPLECAISFAFSIVARPLAALVLILVPLAALAQDPDSLPGQQFLGSAVCQGCHPQVSKGFASNPHFASVAMANKPPERTGCEGCHGPAGLHVVHLDKNLIVRFDALTPAGAQGLCLECHAADFGKLHIQRSTHLTGEVGCTSCHSIHDSHRAESLLADRQRELCYSCHQEIRARFDMPFKHRVNEGAMECTDCHNPHGAPVATWGGAHTPRMVSQALGNDQPCMRCHAEKRGPFVHEHPPVAVEGCGSCHDPHGSTNPRLLNRPAAFTLCMECHGDIAGFGTRAEGIPGPSRWFHNLADPTFRECVLCHSRIHGSNVDRYLRR